MNEISEVSLEFIKENERAIERSYELYQTKPRGGGLKKLQRIKRINEVARLFFDFGYSERKIAELMKITRATVHADLQILYREAFKSLNLGNPIEPVLLSIKRLEMQRNRLRELIQTKPEIYAKLNAERLLLEVDAKIIGLYFKFSDSFVNRHERVVDQLNKRMEKDHKSERFVSWFDLIKVSDKTHDKIRKLIKEGELQ